MSTLQSLSDRQQWSPQGPQGPSLGTQSATGIHCPARRCTSPESRGNIAPRTSELGVTQTQMDPRDWPASALVQLAGQGGSVSALESGHTSIDTAPNDRHFHMQPIGHEALVGSWQCAQSDTTTRTYGGPGELLLSNTTHYDPDFTFRFPEGATRSQAEVSTPTPLTQCQPSATSHTEVCLA